MRKKIILRYPLWIIVIFSVFFVCYTEFCGLHILRAWHMCKIYPKAPIWLFYCSDWLKNAKIWPKSSNFSVSLSDCSKNAKVRSIKILCVWVELALDWFCKIICIPAVDSSILHRWLRDVSSPMEPDGLVWMTLASLLELTSWLVL